MARTRSVDFLPEIFQTSTNRQVLAATLDQLIQEPQLKQIQGFVGRRVGPGVIPGDYYVTEPTATRTNYQLEPGVVQIDPTNSKKVLDAITYPGITDALNLQGAVTQNADQLYTSEYYAWDPFVDFDKYVNYAQYYWLPGGPDAVDVFSGAVPLTDNFVVTRANGAYTFSGVAGENPTLTLVRSTLDNPTSYTFQIAQNEGSSVNYRVSNQGTSAWVIDYLNNPTFGGEEPDLPALVRGNTYTFTLVSTPALPFYIKTQQTLGINNLFNEGVINNGASTGTITFTVPQNAPDTLYYNNSTQMNMQGVFNIIDATPGTGPDFWIQTDPGVNGRIPSTPNISSRLGSVNGVTNNGIDLGTITFDVPPGNADDFYYNLVPITLNSGFVNLITNLQFDQINNQPVEVFNATYNGIDGITDLNNRTLVFQYTADGWERTVFNDPFASIPITDPAVQYGVWQIQYVTLEDVEYITLNSIFPINELQKFTIQFGAVYSNTGWYKDELGVFQQIPLLTATRNRLYYQDGVDPGIFGEINIIDQVAAAALDIVDIIGKKNYTSPNGVVFTNGLKVQFIGSVVPASYQGNSYYVEGVGTAIQLLPVTDFVTPETYTQSSSVPYDSTLYDAGNYDASLNQPAVPDYLTINRASPDLNPWSRSNRWFHISVIEQTAIYNNNPLIVNNALRARRPILEFRSGTRLIDFGTKGKLPVDIIDFSNTDAFSTVNGSTGYGIDGYDLINGSRVIFAVDEDPDVRDKIYVVEFITPDTVPPLLAEPVINLVPAVNGDIVVDNSVVCLSGNTLQGLSFWFDGVEWIAAQQKTSTNQAPLFNVYDANGVSFSDPVVYPSSDFRGSKLFSYAPSDNGKDPVLGFAIKYLSLSNIGDIVFDNNLYTDTFNYTIDSVGYTDNVSLGFVREYQDRVTYRSELGWQTAAVPSRARQQFQFSYDSRPLQLDVAALPNTVIPSIQLYVSSEFQESYKYSVATTADSTTITWTDATYNNGTAFATGDIVEVLVLSDQASKVAFYQVPINLENNPLNVNSPYFTVGTARTHYESICENLLGLVGPINGNNNTRDLGNIIPYGTNIIQNSAPMTLSGYFMRSKQYNIFDSLAYSSREYEQYKAQLLNAAVTTDYTNYTVPAMLTAIITQLIAGRTQNNPFYWTDMLPANPVYTTSTTTYSLISTPTFNLNTTYNFTSSNYQSILVYVNDVLLQSGYDYVVSPDTPTLTITVPLAVGDVIVIQEYATTYGTFIPNTPTKLGLYPAFQPKKYYDTTYVNPAWVIQGHDGSLTLAFNDFRDDLLLEFETRIFNNLKIKSEIPLTLTDVTPGQFRSTGYSLSEINEILAPSFLSWLGWNKLTYSEQTYNASNQFTWNYSAAGNRLSSSTVNNELPLPVGAWRGIYQYFYDTPTPQSTPWEMLGFSQEPTWWTEVYGPAPYTSGNLVLWDDMAVGRVADPAGVYYLPKYARPGLVLYGAGNIGIQNGGTGYSSQTTVTISTPPSGDYATPAILGSPVIVNGVIISIPVANPGSGYLEPPEIIIRDNGGGTGARTSCALTRVQDIIPVDSEGNLLSPFFSVVGLYDSSQWQKSWVFGDEGPVEYSWRTSSAFPFAVMRLLALTRPAEFFSLFADRDLYKYDVDLEQFLYNGRYRLDANGVEIYGNGLSKASYIDWIVDYNRQLGVNSTDKLTKDLSLLDVRLCYRMGTFTDKQYLEIVAETASPDSTNSSLLIPDNSYNLLVYKNQPFTQTLYSAVIVQVVDGGWSVTGYSLTNPYFEILASRTGGPTRVITAGGTRVTVPTTYTQNIVQVPYGYVFTNQTVVADFLLSYGALLESQGLVFDDRENGKTLNWSQMVQEYLYWANQGWMTGSVISLNPTAQQLTLVTPEAIVDSIVTQTPENLILDQNRTTIPTAQLVIDRYENTFRVNSLNEQTISYIALRQTSYESLVILDNVSVFGDLLYDPATGARQSRVTVIATVAAEWNGQLDAQGFINNNTQTVKDWQPLQKYTKGEIVIYKNNYWQALDIVQPSTQWNQSLWSQSNYTKIQGGLLQNIPLLANQLANSYDVNQANLELEQDLFAFGLIGFRPRQYMVDLNLGDISQVNLYQQLIKDKGTLNSVRLLTNANLNKETAQYQIYENWGIQRGIYGANANRRFVEMRLNEALLTANPGTVQITAPQESSLADQTILYADLWRESYNVTSPDIFPTAFMPVTDSALPSAGYVNLQDVDITVFDLDGQLGLATGVLNTIGIGTTVWAAKSNAYDWNVYRCTEVPGYISSATPNLNGTTIVTFTRPPGLAIGDIIIIRFLNTTVDGVYRVLALPGLTSVAIALTITNAVTGSGLGFSLQTMRVSQASDVLTLPYTDSLLPGAKVWVDDNGSGRWEVLEKTDPFTDAGAITPTVPVASSGYGSAVAQGYQNIIAMIGAPTGGDDATGAIYTYVKDVDDNYSENSILLLNANGTTGFGTAIQIGYQNWAVAGASASNSNQGYAVAIYRPTGSTSFEERQLLTSPDGDVSNAEFGYSVTISQDEQWMYVSAPGQNKVYPYGRITIPGQSEEFITTGFYQVYNVGGAIEFDNELQLAVVLNNNLLTIGTDYTVGGTVINLTEVPPPDEKLIITRKVQKDYVGDGAETIFDLGPYLYTADNIYSFIVYIDDVIQVPDVDYTFTASGDYPIEFATAPAVGGAIKIISGTYWQPFTNSTGNVIPIEGPASSRFGSSIHTTTDGRQIVIGASVDESDAGVNSGAVYVFDRSVIRYIISDTTQLTYALPAGYQTPVAVVLNNAYLTNSAQYLNGQFAVDSGNVVLDVALNVGDILEIENNIFTQVQKIVPDTPYDESAFGAAVDVCPNNCSIYSGAPVDGTVLLAAGSVQRNVNQARVYGTITSLYTYQAVQDPTADYSPSFSPGMYEYTGTVYSGGVYRKQYTFIATLIAGDTIRINNMPVAVPASPNNTAAGLAQAIITAAIPNVTASVADGYLTINIVNVAAADAYNRLTVWPGTSGTAFDDLGFNTYAYTQTIVSPNPTASANFGAALNIDTTASTLVVGAPRGDLYEAVIFDNGTTYFDDRSTTFFNEFLESGVVYTFDYLPSATDSVANPGNFVFGQQIYDNLTDPLDQWGAAVNYTTGKLLIGSPTGADNYGRVGQFVNLDRLPAWKTLHQQQPVVDVALLNSVYMYNKLQSQETYFFDFIDPLQGKILGAARQNIDFISQVNPAQYNFGPINNIGNFWGSERVGTIWWDTTNARFIDPNQDDIVYASRRWAQLFPSSTVDIYQWVASSTPPASYTGEGQPLNTTSYSVRAHLNAVGTFETVYYFWVTGITTIAVNEGKTLSTTGIARYIEEPRSSGIPYIAALDASTVAIYNGSQYLSAADTILHIEFLQQLSDANIHSEFQLIADGDPTSFLADNLYQKLQDSFCGYNQNGAQVPDPFLSPPEQYGVAFSPRQSMFVNRLMALENYLTRTNEILKYLPIVEQRRFILLNSSEPVPAAGSEQYNKVLDNIEQLSYQDFYQVPLGYKYLILSDSTYNGAWTIYEVVLDSNAAAAPRVPQLVRIQNFNTKNYWNHIDWYQLGYNSSTTPVAQVPNYSSLVTLDVSVGASVKVTANAQNKWEIYIKTTVGWDRVGLQDGTIAFDNTLWDYAAGRYGFDVEVYDAQYYDQEPVIETRNIIQAINNELFIDDLAIFKNQLLILMFKFILTEEQAPDWLMKTSLINVRHDIRSLLPFPTYRQDNQDFVSDYLQEVKPYHVQVKQFNLVYKGQDDYPGFATDFDNPSYYNTALDIPQFVSPILLPYTKSTAIGTGSPSDIADTPADAEIWATTPWQEWFNNYLLSLISVSVTATGSGYATEPTVVIGTEWTADTTYTVGQQVFYGSNLYSVTVAGTSADVPPAWTTGSELNGTATLTYVGTPATAVAVINSQLQVIAVDVVDEGAGYTTNPVITFVSDSGTGAQARANMGNPLVREFNMTIKYDRYEYLSTITDWDYLVATYPAGTQVRFADVVWEAIDTVTNTPITVNSTGVAGAYTLDVPATTGLTTGMIVTGLVIPADTTVTQINDVDNVVTISRALLQSTSAKPVSFYNPFIVEEWNRVPASTLSGINRTQGFYLPTVDQPGRSLPLLIDGLNYPGVQVYGLAFSYNPGYDTLFITQEQTVVQSAALINKGIQYTIETVGTTNFVDFGAPNNDVGTTFTANWTGDTPTAGTGTVSTATFVRSPATNEFNGAAGSFDSGPFDNIVISPEGFPTYDPAILDARYSSSYIDPFLGTRPTDINVDGGGYIDIFSSYAPEELVPGSEFDTLDFRVYTAPGFDNTGLGHGFPASSIRYVYDPENPVLSFSGALEYPFAVVVFNATLGLAIEAAEYDWANYAVTVGLTETAGDIIDIYVTGVGGGNQLYLNTYNQNSLDEVTVPFAVPSTYDIATEYVQGDVVIYNDEFYRATAVTTGNLPVNLVGWTLTSKGAVVYEILVYNGENQLIDGTNYTVTSSGGSTTVTFDTTYDDTVRINLAVLGYAVDGPTRSWSLPVVQNIISTGGTTIDLVNSMQGTNAVNLIVSDNGQRLNPYQSSEYLGDDTTDTYDLPNSYGYNPVDMIDGDVLVYVDNVKLIQGTDYVVDAWDGISDYRTVTFATAPVDGSKIILSVATGCGYRVYNNALTFLPGSVPADDNAIDIITWNDTAEQGLLTEVFVGPGTNNNTFDLGREIANPERLLVTLNGYWLFNGLDYVLNGTSITISGQTIVSSDVLVVTLFTNRVVPNPTAFRIFQDMRQVQATYRITPSTTTTLVQPVGILDDVIYVEDANALGDPNFATAYNNNILYEIGDVVMYADGFYQAIEPTVGHLPTDTDYWVLTDGAANIWGILTIDGERILYRHRDTAANTVSGLLRGTAGTAVTTHTTGTEVYNMGRENLMPETCQNYIVSNITNPLVPGVNLGDGTTVEFVAEIDISEEPSATRDESVEVFVGGAKIPNTDYTITNDNPVTVEFDTAPPAGAEVAIFVKRAHTWYSLATPLLPLNETDTICARFLQGL